MTDAPGGSAEGRGFGFLIAGVQKGGTSSLFSVLRQHPQIAHPKSKELHFFSSERVDWTDPPYDSYNRQIRWRKTSVIAGEATPRYLFWPGAMERIRAYNPAMRFILSFRDPIERAFSLWAMLKGRDEGQPDFGAMTRAGWAARWPRTAVEVGRGQAASIVSRGFYGQQLEHALELFDHEQFLLLDYHRLFSEVEASLDRIATLLQVSRFRPPDAQHKRAAPQELKAVPPSGQEIAALAELYASDLELFARTSALDVSAWPTSQVLDDRLTPDELAAALTERARLVTPDTRDPRPALLDVQREARGRRNDGSATDRSAE